MHSLPEKRICCYLYAQDIGRNTEGNQCSLACVTKVADAWCNSSRLSSANESNANFETDIESLDEAPKELIKQLHDHLRYVYSDVQKWSDPDQSSNIIEHRNSHLPS